MHFVSVTGFSGFPILTSGCNAQSGDPERSENIADQHSDDMCDQDSAQSKSSTVSAIDSIIREFENRLTIARAVRQLVAEGIEVPDATPILTYDIARAPGARAWSLRPGSNAERIVSLLEEAPNGLAEDEIVRVLQSEGRLAQSKNPIHSVHWTLYNLQRRSGALRRDHMGRWQIIAQIPRRLKKGKR